MVFARNCVNISCEDTIGVIAKRKSANAKQTYIC